MAQRAPLQRYWRALCHQPHRRVHTQPPLYAGARRRPLRVYANHHTLTDYITSYTWQKTLVQHKIKYDRLIERAPSNDTANDSANDSDNDSGSLDEDCLLVVQHQPVYTIGRGGKAHHYQHTNIQPTPLLDLADALSLATNIDAGGDTRVEGAPVYRVDRGGSVTYHGPGQLTVYPIINLNHSPHTRDLHRHLRAMETAVIAACRALGVRETEGQRLHHDSEFTGVWLGQHKLCAIGLSCSRWITSHGLALNVSTDIDSFNVITPCGIEGDDRKVANIKDFIPADNGANIDIDSVTKVLSAELARVFELEAVDSSESIQSKLAQWEAKLAAVR